MSCLLAVYAYQAGWSRFIKLYFVPYLVRISKGFYGTMLTIFTVGEPLDSDVDVLTPH